MKENTKTIERTLDENVREIAQKLGKRYGSLKIVLSAGVLGLSRLTGDEINALVDEIQVKDLKLQKGELPQKKTLQDAIDVIKLKFSDKKAAGASLKLLSQEDQRMLRELRQALGPEPKIEEKRKAN